MNLSSLRPWLGLALLLLVAPALLLGCPPTDDDDSSGDDDDSQPVGDPPEILGLEVCELPTNPEGCPEPAFGAEFRLDLTDADCDLDNPEYFLLIEGNNPAEGRLEGSLGCAGTLRVQLCNNFVRGNEIVFEIWVVDAAGNSSERWDGTWLVPVQSGDDDCGPL